MAVSNFNPSIDAELSVDAFAGTSWSVLRNHSGEHATSPATGGAQIKTHDSDSTEWVVFKRYGMVFDTSSPGPGEVATAATLDLTFHAGAEDFSGTAVLVGFSPDSTSSLIASDYSRTGETKLSDDLLALAGYSWKEVITFTLNAAGLAWLDLNGYSSLAVRIESDRANAEPPWHGNNQDDVTFFTTADADSSLWPVLNVTHSNPSRAGRVYWAEMAVPDSPLRRGLVYWAEMGVPNVPALVEPVIAVLDTIPAAGGGSATRVPQYVKATVTRDRRGRHELTLAGPRNASWASGLVRGQAIHTRLHNSEVFDWRINAVKDGVGPRKEPLTVVVGDPIEVDLMDCGPIRSVESGGITSYVVSWEAQTPTQIITDTIIPALVAYGIDWVSIGTVDPTVTLTGSAEMITPGELLAILEGATGAYFRLRPDGLTGYFLDLVDDLSDGAPTARVRAGVNLIDLARSRSGEDIATVVIVRGSDSGRLRIPVGMATWEVDSITVDGSLFRVTLVDPDGGAGPVVIDDQFVGNDLPASNPKRIPTHYLRYTDATMEEILDTSAPGVFLVADDTGLSVGDLIYISPDNAGTLLTEIHSPTGLGLYNRVVRYYEMDEVEGRDNLSENPLANTWTTQPFNTGCQADGNVSNTDIVHIKNAEPGHVIGAGDLLFKMYGAFTSPTYLEVSVGDTVDAAGDATLTLTAVISGTGIYDLAYMMIYDLTSLPDDWTNEGVGEALFARRPANQDTTVLSGTISEVTTGVGVGSDPRWGFKLGGLTPGDRIYTGDKITALGVDYSALNDSIVDAGGEALIILNKMGPFWAPATAVTVTRVDPGFQDGQTAVLTYVPSATVHVPIIQGPSSPVRFIGGDDTLWARAGLHLVNHSGSALTIESGSDIEPPSIAIWDGASEVASFTPAAFEIADGEEVVLILSTSVLLAAWA